jgi:nitrous oxide reductase
MAEAQHLRGGVSRRKALLTGAGLVAAGAVAGAAGGVVTTKAAEGTLSAAKENPKVPMMVHLRDAPTGKFDIFFGEVKVEVTDTNFAAKLVDAAAKAA